MGHPPLEPAARRRHKLRNVAQAVLLMAAMVAMLALSAWLIAGTAGVVAVGVVAGVTLVVRPRVPPTWVLHMYGAQPLPVAPAILCPVRPRRGSPPG